MKKLAFLLLALLMLFVLSGCNLIGHDEELDLKQVVATVNGDAITKGDWLNFRSYMAAYYQQMYRQYGLNITPNPEDFSEEALEQLIQEKVLDAKMTELGIKPLPEADQADVESYADSMMDLYKMMIRYQNYPDLETVEEEAERLAAAAAEETADETEAPADAAETAEGAETPEETPEETEAPADAAETAETPEETEAPADLTPKATVTNAELDEMLLRDLAAMGYTREYFMESRTASVQSDKLHAHTSEGVEVTDDEVQQEYTSRAAEQQAKYDETPASYASDVNAGTAAYYIPAGYRGVKNLLISISDESSSEITALQTTVTDAQTAIDSANTQLEALRNPEEGAEADETAVAEQIAALEETVATKQAELDEAQAALEARRTAAFDEIRPAAEAALERARAGEDFDALIEELGTDSGMKTEPNKSRGYLVCEGMTQFVEPFQTAAMALQSVGDVSELVETQYGFHILQYAGDIESGVQALTDEQAEALRSELLETKQDAAYTSQVSQWMSEATIKRFPKVMK